jgi:holliday junction DNA helicase RuvA
VIAYVRGTLTHIGSEYIVVEAGGLGYRIFVPGSTIGRLPVVGQEIKLHTYHHVREDAMTLFGFLTHDEHDIFNHLISVSGIGPKGALTILGGLEPHQFIQAVIQGELQVLTKISGIGKKTAERLILELKDKLGTLAACNVSLNHESRIDATVYGGDEAFEALVALGYTSQEANRALTEARKCLPSTAPVDALIRQALRSVMTREVK